MSEVKHTPGPWIAETNEKSSSIAILGLHGDKGRCRSSDGHGQIVLVDCADAMSDDTMFAPMLDEQKANARLIAAAPDLLEALKRLEAVTRILPESMDEPNSPLAQARFAIAKATGETP